MDFKNNHNSILFIGSFLSKHRGTKGVSETIAENLKKEGINVILSSRFENKLLRIFQIIKDIVLFRGKLVHVDVFSGNAFNIALLASQLAGIKNATLVLTLHGGNLIEFDKKNKSKIDLLLSMANKIQTPSLLLKNYFCERGFDVFYLPNPINLDNFPFQIKEKNDFRILWVRCFSDIYNPHVAIEVINKLKQTFPSVSLSMIGPDRGLMHSCRTLSEKLNLSEKIFFSGPVKNEELKEFFHTHDVFLNTTSLESFGVALIEAASCGIPIVSTSVGEIPLLWQNEKNALLGKENSAVELASKIEKLWTTAGLSTILVKEARKKAESFAWEKIKPHWINLIKNHGF